MIEIKSISGGSVVPFYGLKLLNMSASDAFMEERQISGEVVTLLDIPSEEWVSSAFIEYDDEWWYISEPPEREKNNEQREFIYTAVVFKPIDYQLRDIDFLDVVTDNSGGITSGINNVQFFGNIVELVDRIKANLQNKRSLGWIIDIEADVPTDEYKQVSLDDAKVWDALLLVNTLYNLKFTTFGKSIKVWSTTGTISHYNAITEQTKTHNLGVTIAKEFEYGSQGGLYNITKSPTGEKPIAHIRGVGSTKNMPLNYYRTSPRFTIGYYGYAPYLMPPIFTEGDTGIPPFTRDYYSDTEQVAIGNIREKFIRFDGSGDMEEIHPTIEGVVFGGKRIDEIKSVSDLGSDDFDETGKALSPQFDVVLNPLGFNISEAISANGELTLSMKTGRCAGANFKVVSINGRNISGVGLKKAIFQRPRDIWSIEEIMDGEEATINILSFTQPVGRMTKISLSAVKWGSFTSVTNLSTEDENYTLTIEPYLYNRSTEETIALSGGTVLNVTPTTPSTILVGEDFIAAQDVVSMGEGFLQSGMWEMSVRIKLDAAGVKTIGGKINLFADFNPDIPFLTDDATLRQPDIETKDVTLTLQKSIDDFNELMPSLLLPIQAGDRFVLINIDLPDSYVIAAEQRLEDAILKHLVENNFDKMIYTGKVFPPLLLDDTTIQPNLRTGSKIKLKDLDEALEIVNITYQKDNAEIFGIYTFQLKETTKRERRGTRWLADRLNRLLANYNSNIINNTAFNRSILAQTQAIEERVFSMNASSSSDVDMSQYVRKRGDTVTGTLNIKKAVPTTLILPDSPPDVEAGQYAISVYSAGIGGETPSGGGVTNLYELEDLMLVNPTNDQVLSYINGKWVNRTLEIITSVSWDDITGKPSTFPPSSHTHNYHPLGGDITIDFTAKKLKSATLLLPTTVPDTAAGEYAISLYSAGIGGETPPENMIAKLADITDIILTYPTNQEVLTYEDGVWKNKPIDVGVTSWNDLEDKPSTFPPSEHTHSQYVPTTRTVNNKQLNANISLSYLDVGAAPDSHTHNDYVPTTRTINNKQLNANITLSNTDVGAAAKNGSATEDFAAKDINATKVVVTSIKINGYTITI